VTPGTPPPDPNPSSTLPRRTDLGTFGGASSYAFDLNDGAMVVGAAQTASGQFRAFRWTLDGGLQELSPLPGDVQSRALAITNDSVAVGFSTSETGAVRPVTWAASGEVVQLPIPPITGADLIPNDRNTHGVIAGDALFREDPFNVSHAWVWTPATGLRDLADELEVPSENSAAAVNDGGTVVGTTGGELLRAFRWSPESGPEGLGVPGSAPERTAVTALSLNGEGVIVGWASIQADEEGGTASAPFPGFGSYPFIWREGAGFSLLPVFDASSQSNASADDLNGRGDVVGSAAAADGTIQAAAWLRGGAIVNLNDPDPNPSVALAVNSTGIAAGWTSTDGGQGTNRATVWNLDLATAITARQGRRGGVERPAWTRTATGAAACLRRPDAMVSKARMARCFEEGA
jgi:uncharacterized membrane protein